MEKDALSSSIMAHVLSPESQVTDHESCGRAICVYFDAIANLHVKPQHPSPSDIF